MRNSHTLVPGFLFSTFHSVLLFTHFQSKGNTGQILQGDSDPELLCLSTRDRHMGDVLEACVYWAASKNFPKTLEGRGGQGSRSKEADSTWNIFFCTLDTITWTIARASEDLVGEIHVPVRWSDIYGLLPSWQVCFAMR